MKTIVSILLLALGSLISVQGKLLKTTISQFMRPVLRSTLATSLVAASLAMNPIVSHAAIGEGKRHYLLICITNVFT